MKYTIETEEEEEFRLHFNGPKLYSAMWEFQNYLRDKWKYSDPENKAWWEAYQELTNILLDHEINMEEDYC